MNMQASKPFARTQRRAFALLTSLLCVVAALVGVDVAYAQSPLDGFAPSFNNEVRALALQSDGKLLVGGAFTQVGLTPRNRLVRLDPTGALDTIFSVSVNQTVHALAVDASDRVLVGGAFTQVGGSTRNRIARLNADGSLDTSFNPNIDGTVYALRVLQDGSIVVAGDFTTVGGAPRAYLARLDSSGALDPTIAPTVNGPVYALAMQRSGALVIGGAFTQINGETRQHIARFDAGGTLDVQFAPNLNGTVRALAIGIGDAILAGGEFTTVDGAARGRLAHFTAAGALASAPALTFDNTVHTLLTQADGRVVVGGAFTSVGGQARSRLVRLALDHSLDPTFTPDPNNTVYALLSQMDDKFVAGGAFTVVSGGLRNRAARFYTDGSLDADFAPAANAETNAQALAIAVQPDDKIVVGGTFVAFAGEPRLRVARFYPDGRLDASFNPGASNEVRALAIQPDGKIVVGGDFTQIAGQNRSFIARLLPDGQLDTSFAPFEDSGVLSVLAVALQPDGRIVIAIAPKTQSDKRPRLLRLNSDGSIDTTFQAALDEGQVTALAIQTDGQIIACGEFPFISAIGPSGNLARLTQNGALDANYAPEVTRCLAVRLQPDGRLLFGGLNPLLLARFNPNGAIDTSFNTNLTGRYVSSIVLQSDGRLLVAVNDTDELDNNLGSAVRVRENGSTDTTFAVLGADGAVLAAALQRDGKVVLGGGFTTFNTPDGGNAARVWLARLSNPTAAQQMVTAASDGRTFTWRQEGAFPSLSSANFAYSTDGNAFIEIGAGTRTVGGWQAQHSAPIFNQEIFLRAAGEYAGGGFDASISRTGATRRLFVPGGEIEVTTTVVPTELTPPWIVAVTGVTVLSNAAITGTGTTGVRPVEPGVYTTTLRAGAGVSLDEYHTTYTCTDNGQPIANGEGAVAVTPVSAGSSVRCQFTNSRRAGVLTVGHRILPPSPSSAWQLTVAGPTAFTESLVGDDETDARVVFSGLYTVSISTSGAASSGDFATTYACTVDGQPGPSGAGQSVQVTVNGESVMRCDFTSTRRTGVLEVRHEIEPAAPTSEWLAQVTGPTSFTATLTGNDSTNQRSVFTGGYIIDLTPNDGIRYITSYQCTADGQPLVSGEGGQASLTVGEQQVLCIFGSRIDPIQNRLYLPTVTR